MTGSPVSQPTQQVATLLLLVWAVTRFVIRCPNSGNIDTAQASNAQDRLESQRPMIRLFARRRLAADVFNNIDSARTFPPFRYIIPWPAYCESIDSDNRRGFRNPVCAS
jgi:hypothetical protein